MEKARIMGCLVKLGFAVDVAEKIAQKVEIEGNKSLYLGHGVTVLIEKHTH